MAPVVGVIFCAALSSVFFSSIYCANSVPVVIWHSQSLGNDLPSVSAVDHISSKDFEADISPFLKNKGPLLLFLQDTLSVEDFTMYGNVFRSKNQKNSFSHVETILENNPSTMFPSVVSPKSSIFSIANDRNRIDFNSGTVDYTDLNDSFVVVSLPHTETVQDRQQALATNDKLIGEVIARVTAGSQAYTAIYTGQRPSWDEGEEDAKRTRRHTLAEESGNFTLVLRNSTSNNTCFMFYADSLSLNMNNTGVQFNVSMSDLWIDPSSSDCSDDTVLNVTISTTNQALSQFKLSFDFGRAQYNDWIINNITLTTSDGSVYSVWLPPQSIWAPQMFCYHCTPQKFRLQSATDNNAGTLYAPNFQIQAFEFEDNPDAPFGDYFDCVGFFSIAIWMTIFFSIILVLVLGFGINAIMSIRTMDRFDDPKGKTISVSATD